jgi:hypothetical protein
MFVRYVETSRMPKSEQLVRVSAYHSSSAPNSKGAAEAAGWFHFRGTNTALTGEVFFHGNIFVVVAVFLDSGFANWSSVDSDVSMAVCLR